LLKLGSKRELMKMEGKEQSLSRTLTNFENAKDNIKSEIENVENERNTKVKEQEAQKIKMKEDQRMLKESNEEAQSLAEQTKKQNDDLILHQNKFVEATSQKANLEIRKQELIVSAHKIDIEINEITARIEVLEKQLQECDMSEEEKNRKNKQCSGKFGKTKYR